MHKRTILATGAAGVGLAILLAFNPVGGADSAPAKPPIERGPLGHKAHGPGGHVITGVPADASGKDLYVWRNGACHKIHVPVNRRSDNEDGAVAETITMDADAAADAQIGPADPAKASLQPTDEQMRKGCAP